MRAEAVCIRALAAFLLAGTGHAALFRRDGWMPWWNGGTTTTADFSIRHDYNASGSVDIPGVDLTRPYPGAGAGANVSGWSLAVRAYGLRPMKPASSAREAVFSAYSQPTVEFRAGTFAGAELDDRWSVCIFSWTEGLPYREDVADLRDDAGLTCRPVLSDPCMAHMEQLAREDGGACERLTRFDTTRTGECRRLQGSSSTRHHLRANNTRLIAAVRESRNGSSYIESGGWGYREDEGDDVGARLRYDRAVTEAVPVMVAYHWHDRAGNGSGNVTLPFVRCLRPANLQPGSSKTETDGGRKSVNGASVLPSPGGPWALGLWAPAVICSLALALL